MHTQSAETVRQRNPYFSDHASFYNAPLHDTVSRSSGHSQRLFVWRANIHDALTLAKAVCGHNDPSDDQRVYMWQSIDALHLLPPSETIVALTAQLGATTPKPKPALKPSKKPASKPALKPAPKPAPKPSNKPSSLLPKCAGKIAGNNRECDGVTFQVPKACCDPKHLGAAAPVCPPQRLVLPAPHAPQPRLQPLGRQHHSVQGVRHTITPSEVLGQCAAGQLLGPQRWARQCHDDTTPPGLSQCAALDLS